MTPKRSCEQWPADECTRPQVAAAAIGGGERVAERKEGATARTAPSQLLDAEARRAEIVQESCSS